MTTAAVIDLGTSSTRLLVTDGITREAFPPVVTRMGAALASTGAISSDGLDRVRSTLHEYRAQIERIAPDHLSVIATSAARDAVNAEDLFDVVADVLGVETRLLTGAEEGRLAFRGAAAAADLPETQRLVVLDIGGGSTEVSIGTKAAGLVGVYSADIGAGRVTDTYLHGDPPGADELSAALSVIQLHFDDARRELDDLDGAISYGTVIGVGGTITTMAAVELGLVQYDSDQIHHFRLDRDAAEDVFRVLATEARADRAYNPGLPADRVDLIVGGAAIVVESMRHLAIDEVLVSEHDILDGVAAEMMDL